MYSLALRKNFERIYAFEPEDRAFKTLARRSARSIIPVKLAVCDRESWVYLHLPENTCATILDGFRHCPPSHPKMDIFITAKNGEYVRSTTIDTFANMHNLETIDLVKVDVEGAEFLVLQGCRNTLFQSRIRNIMVELHNRNRKQELESLLEASHFTIEWVDPDHILGVGR